LVAAKPKRCAFAFVPSNLSINFATFWRYVEGNIVIFPQVGRRIELEFAPTGLFSRFIIRMFHFTDVQKYWRSGILLKETDGQSWALVHIA
jgi:hypothetical protein